MKQILNSEELIGKTIENFYFSEEELWMKFTDSIFVVIEMDDGMVVSDYIRDKTSSELVKIGLVTEAEHKAALIEQEERWKKKMQERDKQLLKQKEDEERKLYKVLHEKYGNQGLTDSIFLIEKIWIDSWENEIGRAVGYLPHCFANTKEEAEEFCSKGRIYTRKDCWAIYGAQPEYKYSELKHCKQDGI